MKVFLCDLIHNYALGHNQISGNEDYVVPLNVADIGSYVQEVFRDSLELKLFKYAGDLLSALEEETPDVLGLTNYNWSADLNFRIGSFIRERYPEILMVMGGPSIRTDRPGIESFLRRNPYVDIYVMFEGELTFAEILRKYEAEGKKFLEADSGLSGGAYLEGGALVYHEFKPTSPIEHFPSPYLNGMLDPFLEQGLIPLFETNRGCPFTCTFCIWGISALNKVRTYPLERVFAEFEYVAGKFPRHPAWIIADANFGLLARDVDIARKIKEIKDRTPALRSILTWESKNTTERNFEIARIMKSDFGDALIAVQTLDEKAQAAVKRKNIRLDHVPGKIRAFKAAGARVGTHVLSGLPEETYGGHLETLRKCFELGFDHIDVVSTLLLPGSELESGASRERYKLKTKYRTRQGAYGEYHGIRSVESEEIIRGNSAISESEMLSLRRVHWLVWYGWNHGFLKPLLQFAHEEHGWNPLDVLLEIAHGEKKDHPVVDRMFGDFDGDATSEWFDSHESLLKYYTAPEGWEEFLQNGFSKVEFKYNALMIIHRSIFHALVACLLDILKRRIASPSLEDIASILEELRIEPDALWAGNIAEEKVIRIPPAIARYTRDSGSGGGQSAIRGSKPRGRASGSCLVLTKSREHQEEIRTLLSKYGYDNNKTFAVEKTLGARSDAFVYDISFVGDEREPMPETALHAAAEA